MYTSPLNKIPSLCIMGPTTTGKTDLAITLANHIPCEIISADSAMVYRGLDIGTAKPSPEIRQAIPHHLIDICEANEIYTAGNFCRDTTALIKAIHMRGKIPLIVGGTMLYFHLLQNGMANLPSRNDDIRRKLTQQAQKKGWQTLHKMLENIDSKTAQKLHPNDAQRIQRALEIYYITGKTPSELYAEQKRQSPFYYHSIILLPLSKASLHERIKARFEKMLSNGFVHEVDTLLKQKGLSSELPALRTVGYKQIGQYLQGYYNYETMVEKALLATRHLAKHQLTWLKRWETASTFVRCDNDTEKLIQKILDQVRNIQHKE